MTLEGILPQLPTLLQTGKGRWLQATVQYARLAVHPHVRDVLAAPCGALHFAGEATNADHPATVHGAIESGQRAAREVVQSLA